MTIEQGDTAAYTFPAGTDIKIFKPTIVAITEESIKEYGRIVKDFNDPTDSKIEIVPYKTTGWRQLDPGTGMGGGVTTGSFKLYRQGHFCEGKNQAVAGADTSGQYTTGTFFDPINQLVNPNNIYTREANYHPDGEQLFFPKGKPFVLLLALPSDDIKPEDFVAFYGDGSLGVCIKPNIWHQPPFPVGPDAEFDGKQGAVHGCVSVDFVKEFNTLIKVPLQLPKELSKEEEMEVINQFIAGIDAKCKVKTL